MKYVLSVALVGVVLLLGCMGAIRSGPLIDHYDRAACVPVQFGPGIIPPTRAWDSTLETREGIAARVSGSEIPGGRIDVTYRADGKDAVAADAGNYIYAADVRFDSGSGRLYVKASGITAAFGKPQTWLFEYDLGARRRTKHARVDPTVLPPECPVK